MTWELVKKELDLKNVPKGESVYVVRAEPLIMSDSGFFDTGGCKFFKVKAR